MKGQFTNALAHTCPMVAINQKAYYTVNNITQNSVKKQIPLQKLCLRKMLCFKFKVIEKTRINDNWVVIKHAQACPIVTIARSKQ